MRRQTRRGQPERRRHNIGSQHMVLRLEKRFRDFETFSLSYSRKRQHGPKWKAVIVLRPEGEKVTKIEGDGFNELEALLDAALGLACQQRVRAEHEERLRQKELFAHMGVGPVEGRFAHIHVGLEEGPVDVDPAELPRLASVLSGDGEVAPVFPEVQRQMEGSTQRARLEDVMLHPSDPDFERVAIEHGYRIEERDGFKVAIPPSPEKLFGAQALPRPPAPRADG